MNNLKPKSQILVNQHLAWRSRLMSSMTICPSFSNQLVTTGGLSSLNHINFIIPNLALNLKRHSAVRTIIFEAAGRPAQSLAMLILAKFLASQARRLSSYLPKYLEVYLLSTLPSSTKIARPDKKYLA